MPSLLDDVNELINKQIGDLSRLTHIKESIENNKQLYNSDRNYLEELIKNNLLSNEKNTKNHFHNTNEKTDETPKHKSKKTSQTPHPKPINQKMEREDSVITAIFLGIVGTIITLIGFGIIVYSLTIPAFIAGQYTILGLIVSVIGGIIIYGASKTVKKKQSHFICGYCGYIAETERELYNHSLICEKKKSEELNPEN